MNNGKYIFAQLTEFLPQRVFDGLVKKYKGNRYVKHFTCWNQLLCMVFGQLTNRDSLRDLIVIIEAHSKKTALPEHKKYTASTLFGMLVPS
jgi:hypothetical protein